MNLFSPLFWLVFEHFEHASDGLTYPSVSESCMKFNLTLNKGGEEKKEMELKFPFCMIHQIILFLYVVGGSAGIHEVSAPVRNQTSEGRRRFIWKYSTSRAGCKSDRPRCRWMLFPLYDIMRHETEMVTGCSPQMVLCGNAES